MSKDTKERILESALELFAQNGYTGTSMSEIANKSGVTKAALYKHFIAKQEILDSIVNKMCASDYDRAEEYEMPVSLPDGNSDEYKKTEIENLREYSLAQFDYWTKETLPSNSRKMLTLEQYRDKKLAKLYHDYIASGPAEYLAAVFRKFTDSDESAMQLALEFYGPMFLLYSIYDGAAQKEGIASMLKAHIESFISKLEL